MECDGCGEYCNSVYKTDLGWLCEGCYEMWKRKEKKKAKRMTEAQRRNARLEETT